MHAYDEWKQKKSCIEIRKTYIMELRKKSKESTIYYRRAWKRNDTSFQKKSRF